MNTVGTTISYLGRQSAAAAYDKLLSIVRHNVEAIRLQLAHVAARPALERLHRLPSDVMPGYTHPDVAPYYADADIRRVLEEGLSEAGRLARAADIRISMHPSQFCVIASANPAALKNGLDEFHYHAEIAELMGYGGGWHPHGAHLNIHAGGRAGGVEGVRAGLPLLSETARNLITLENDEISYGLDDLLGLADALPIVLDLHHHWIFSRGEYLEPDDPRVGRIIESWRGVRPVSHVSVSREMLFAAIDPINRPAFETLLAAGLTVRDLRGHSDLMWNEGVNELVSRHLAWSDFEIEAKLKNLASEGIAGFIEARRGPPALAAE
jgi:UV DNA damage endonuclease